VTFAVTDHAVERYLQRVRGTLDPRAEIVREVSHAWAEGRVAEGERRGDVRVQDRRRPGLVYVCRWDRPNDEVVVITLWEEGEDAAVPRRSTDALP
jgi:hypothetical protein